MGIFNVPIPLGCIFTQSKKGRQIWLPRLWQLCSRAPCSNHFRVPRYILSILIACALVVPGIAWGAHLAGHAPLHAAEDAHSHDVGGDTLAAHHDDEGGAVDEAPDRPAKGLVHDHAGAHAHASIIVEPIDALALADYDTDQLLFNRRTRNGTLPRPDPLLRPPRAA
jgi:hypothetical protein